MKLYSYWRSSCSWRVRLALGFKNISAEIVPIHLVKNGGEQFSAEYSSRNPLHQVPSLELEDGTIITQSLAIIDFLEESHPSLSLYPSEMKARIKVKELAEMINSGIQPLQNLALLLKLESLQEGLKLTWGREVIEKGLLALEQKVKYSAGKFLVGNQFSVADCCLIPQLYNARRFGCDLSNMPTLLEVEKNCTLLPFFAAAHPDQQIDAAL